MSNLIPKIIPLVAGLDLSSPKILAEPGSLLDCLNYEITDIAGYKRIDGFQRYDGNVSLKDIPNPKVYTAAVTGTGTIGAGITNEAFEDEFGNIIGFVFSAVPISGGPNATITYISFVGGIALSGFMSTTAWSFTSVPVAHTEALYTQSEMIALENYLLGLVESLPYTPVGLHWYDNHLYAVVPLLMIPYAVSVNNQPVVYELNESISSTEGGFGTLLGKTVTQEAGASTNEEGYFILAAGASGDWDAPVADTDTLSGAVTVAAGVIYHQPGTLSGMDSDVCSLWKAARPSTYTSTDKAVIVTGWLTTGILNSFTLTVTLNKAPSSVPVLNTLRKNNTEAESTYYFASGSGVIRATVLDYFIVSGSFEGGDAVLRLQVSALGVESGTPGTDIGILFEMTTDAAGLLDIGNVTTRMSYNYLPGLPLLTEHSSRYEFKTANFYAADDAIQMYGVSGAGRAFAFDGRYISFIYTQDDDDLDKPRHLENHALHLALGFPQGSVQLSVVGEPTNFSGVFGASEIGVGDRVTGLMELEGTTLGVFCEQSIWSVVGTSVDNFQTQVIAPNTGCIEYSLANCGEPVYLDNHGISTLQTSANYGDFIGNKVSAPVASWLRPRCQSSIIAINNASGVACALPIRHKNQYRLFFNDGAILTMTLRDGPAGFTFQTYYLNQAAITDTSYKLVPVCGTSEVDRYGIERTYVAHYNTDSPVESNHVYALDSGASFDGNYIPHYFDTNWYFADNPAQFQTLQGVRLYGLSRGMAELKVQSAGAQNDMAFGGTTLTTTTTPINLPRVSSGLSTYYRDSTNRAEIVARGLATRLRFSGSNTNLNLIEPSYVAQVLMTYSVPDGAFDL